MSTQRSSLIVFSVLLVMALAACGTQSSGPAAAVQSQSNSATQSAPTKAAAAAGNGGCSNAYYPSSQGATWKYANTSPMAPDSTTTRTLAAISANEFTSDDTVSGGINVVTTWRCQDGNLTMLETNSGMQDAPSGTMVWTTKVASVSGFLIPAAITSGQTWSEKLALSGIGFIDAQQRATQQNDTQIVCTAGGNESITVGAGTFNAIKVTCNYTITTTTSIDGAAANPVTNTIAVTDWYVSKVGSVKTVKTGDISENIELTSYSIP